MGRHRRAHAAELASGLPMGGRRSSARQGLGPQRLAHGPLDEWRGGPGRGSHGLSASLMAVSRMGLPTNGGGEPRRSNRMRLSGLPTGGGRSSAPQGLGPQRLAHGRQRAALSRRGMAGSFHAALHARAMAFACRRVSPEALACRALPIGLGLRLSAPRLWPTPPLAIGAGVTPRAQGPARAPSLQSPIVRLCSASTYLANQSLYRSVLHKSLSSNAMIK